MARSVILAVMCLVLCSAVDAQTVSEVCSQKLDKGECVASYTLYGYNTATGKCEAFTYTGCGGNSNRFKDLNTCNGVCKDKTIKVPEVPYYPQSRSKCLVRKDPGNCAGTRSYYYFDFLTDSCKLATFSSCPGNLNYFRYKSVCESSCMPNTVRKVPDLSTDATCAQPLDAGTCDKSYTVYGYDSASGSCKAFTYTGCGGNTNRFKDASTCNNVCGTKTAPVPEVPYYAQSRSKCLVRKNPGTCDSYRIYYYFDHLTETCKTATFTTCPGNLNYFRFKSVCESSCFPN